MWLLKTMRQTGISLFFASLVNWVTLNVDGQWLLLSTSNLIKYNEEFNNIIAYKSMHQLLLFFFQRMNHTWLPVLPNGQRSKWGAISFEIRQKKKRLEEELTFLQRIAWAWDMASSKGQSSTSVTDKILTLQKNKTMVKLYVINPSKSSMMLWKKYKNDSHCESGK